jgi:ornithine cyclodeaminase/alanine dehydrogenase-like protein (mu-crystallin family)
VIWLSESDVEVLLEPATLVARIEASFRTMSRDYVIEPDSTRIDGIGAARNYLTVFPSHCVSTGIATAKVLAGARDSRRLGQPEIDAVVVAVDASSARIRAVIAARTLTALRTAATTTVAVRHLMGAAASHEIGLIGTGGQARAHARALAAVGIARSFVVASPTGGAARAKAFAAQIAVLTGRPAAGVSVGQAASKATVVIAATLSGTPLVGDELGGDAMVVSIGPFYPGDTEIDPHLCRTAAIVVSDHPARLRRQWTALPAILPERLVSLEDLVAGAAARPAAGRAIFLSDGRAFEDNVAAGLVLEAAAETGRGLVLP